MKNTLLTIALTTLVVDSLRTHMHNKKVAAQSPKKNPPRPRMDEISALKRASFALKMRESRGLYDYGVTPERLVEDLEFELIVARL